MSVGKTSLTAGVICIRYDAKIDIPLDISNSDLLSQNKHMGEDDVCETKTHFSSDYQSFTY